MSEDKKRKPNPAHAGETESEKQTVVLGRDRWTRTSYLPEVEANSPDVGVAVQVVVSLVLWVVNLGMHPFTLVGGVVDLAGFPFTLK